MLEVEEMHTEILIFAKNHDGYLSNLANIMHLILHKYPADCFEISKTKIAASLEKNMGRNYYHEVAALLKFLSSEETIINSVNATVQEICTLYSRRPALRDELRQSGLLIR